MENKRDSSQKTVSPSESLQKMDGRLGSLHTLDHSFIWKDAVGDFLAKPAGRNIAHAFYNSGHEHLCILDIGTADPEDTCYYPDERMYLHKTNGEARPYHVDSVDTGWSSEPNKPNNQKGDL